jgi:hypothetical protein
MFNADLAPITRSVRVETTVFFHGALGEGQLREGETVHSVETDWDATAAGREDGDLKWSESIEIINITTIAAVREAEAAEASKAVGTMADIWPTI